MGKRSSIDNHRWWQNIKNHRFIRFVLFLLIGVATYSLMLSNVIPKTLEIEVGYLAEEDIRSTITIENKEETERLRQEAYESINPIFTMKTRFAQNQVERVNDIYNTIRQVKREARDREREILEIEEEIAKLEETRSLQNELNDSNDENADSNQTSNNNDDVIIPEIPDRITIDEQIQKVRSIITEATTGEISDETIKTLLMATDDD